MLKPATLVERTLVVLAYVWLVVAAVMLVTGLVMSAPNNLSPIFVGVFNAIGCIAVAAIFGCAAEILKRLRTIEHNVYSAASTITDRTTAERPVAPHEEATTNVTTAPDDAPLGDPTLPVWAVISVGPDGAVAERRIHAADEEEIGTVLRERGHDIVRITRVE